MAKFDADFPKVAAALKRMRTSPPDPALVAVVADALEELAEKVHEHIRQPPPPPSPDTRLGGQFR